MSIAISPSGSLADALQIVGTGGMLACEATGPGHGMTLQDSRVRFALGPQDVDGLRLAYTNVYSDPKTAKDKAIATEIALRSAIELTMPSDETRTLANTFAGNPNPSFGLTPTCLVTDPLDLRLSAGTTGFTRSAWTCQDGGVLPTGHVAQYRGSGQASGGEGFRNSSAETEVYGTGPLSQGIDAASDLFRPTGCGPIAVLGIPRVRHVAVVLAGDSLIQGVGDDLSLTNGAKGFGERGLAGAGHHPIPWINLSRNGDRLFFANSPLTRLRKDFWRYATHMICNLGTNDIPSRSLLQMQSDARAFWLEARQAGLRVYHCTVSPWGYSKDQWSTVEGQTIRPGYENIESWHSSNADKPTSPGQRGAWNDWLRQQAENGTIDGLIDTNAALEHPDFPGLWKVNGSPRYATIDGAHLAAGGAMLAARAVSEAAGSWSV